MRVAYDITLMRPACVLVAAALGADSQCSNKFNADHWLLAPTEGMKVFEITADQLKQLVTMTEKAND